MTDPRHAQGSEAERAVVAHIERAGMTLVGTNVRVGRLEIDVVARDGRVIVVIEVRTRGAGAWTSGFGSIDGQKRMRIRRAGERLWQRRYKNDASVDRLRFDAASVSFEDGQPHVEYVRAAF